MSVVAITGVAGYVGQHLLRALERNHLTRIVGIDLVEPPGSPSLEFHQLDIRDGDLARALAGVDVLVHLAFRHDPIRDEADMRSVNVDGTASVLAAAGRAGVRSVVFASSAIVYGAHADNDIPLSESSPLRANADYSVATHLLEAERAFETFGREHPDVTVTVLRAALVLGPGSDNFLARLLEAPRLTTVKGFEPPLQVLHEEDMASVLTRAVEGGLSGVYNVAADGWLSAEEVEELAGKRRVEIPEGVAFAMAERLWRGGLTTAPPGELHFVMHPWVMDTARLRREGWSPRHTNAETLIETVEAHRNWIALGRARMRKDTIARGAAAALGAIGAFALVRRARRRD